MAETQSAIETEDFIFGVDLDGVCADFYSGIKAIAEEWLEVQAGSLPADVGYGLSEWSLESMGGYDHLHRFAVTERGLFKNLKPIPGAAASLRRLSVQGVRIRIITHRLFIKHFHRQAIQQTIEWLDHHDFPYWDLCFMRDKTNVGAHIYVDDAPHNIAALRQTGREVIVFANSTNKDCAPPRAGTWDEVEALVLKAKESRKQ